MGSLESVLRAAPGPPLFHGHHVTRMLTANDGSMTERVAPACSARIASHRPGRAQARERQRHAGRRHGSVQRAGVRHDRPRPVPAEVVARRPGAGRPCRATVAGTGVARMMAVGPAGGESTCPKQADAAVRISSGAGAKCNNTREGESRELGMRVTRTAGLPDALDAMALAGIEPATGRSPQVSRGGAVPASSRRRRPTRKRHPADIRLSDRVPTLRRSNDFVTKFGAFGRRPAGGVRVRLFPFPTFRCHRTPR